jgi:2-pyrone-4,6-dicarboxylate lactonase
MRATLPSGAWDCHTHIYGPWEQFQLPKGAAYQPAAAPFHALLAMHARLGIERGVLVQAACYGTDHSALLAALASSQGRYRGIALIDEATSNAQLQALHDGGVRGVRFNLMGHLPGQRDPTYLQRLARKIKPLGWHVLVHGEIRELLPVLEALEGIGIVTVIDHMARQDGLKEVDESAVRALEAHLERSQCWIKLSGVDRMMKGAAPPWNAALPMARRLFRRAPERAIWGSDWPHPNIVGDVPDDAALLNFVLEACGDGAAARAVLFDNPTRIYR